MPMSQMFLPEFDHEMATTRKFLERVPEDKFGWKPHEKSMTMLRLAGHIAEMPGWSTYTMNMDSLDVAPVGGPQYQPAKLESRQAILDEFDKNVKEGRAAVEKASDESLGKPWSLLAGGKNIFTMPRIAVLRSMVLNHVIHHRGQLSVYLRLNGVAVPGAYGPSADEGQM
jgi:uncharacterized damage-inducible protein DinB